MLKKHLLALAAAVGFGVVAVWLPSVADPAAPVMDSWVRAAVERPSVWTFQAFFVVGFLVGIFAPMGWLDPPLYAAAMVGLFPLKAAKEMAQGAAWVDWPREFYLHAAWLIPALLGLAVGKLIRDIQRKSRKPPGSGKGRQRKR